MQVQGETSMTINHEYVEKMQILFDVKNNSYLDSNLEKMEFTQSCKALKFLEIEDFIQGKEIVIRGAKLESLKIIGTSRIREL